MPGSTLVVAASVPLRGVDAGLGRAVLDGERLALRDAGGRAGAFRVRLVARDSVEAGRPDWSPARVAENARRAAQDPRTIAALGEVEPAASAVSVEILNQRGIVELSPTDSFGGLTRAEGAEPGEPDKYYPRGNRTFGRLVADDDRQADALAAWLRGAGTRRVEVLDDRALYGHALAEQVATAARRAGLTVVGGESVDLRGADVAKLVGVADRVAQHRPDAVVLGATPTPAVPRLWRLLHERLPGARLVAAAGLARAAFVAHLGAAAGATSVLAPDLAPAAGAAGRTFTHRFARVYGRRPSPGAASGYEAMRAVLDAIHRAGPAGRRRAAVLHRVLATRRTASAIGPFALDPNGDVVPARLAIYGVRARRLHLVQHLP